MSERLTADVASMIRRHFMPEFASEHTTERVCRGCGQRFLCWKRDRHPRCPDCSYRRQVQMETSDTTAEDSTYRAAVKAAYLYYCAEAERLGLTTPGPPGGPRTD